MLPGPVFTVELLTTARRPRFYALRVLYGLMLLILIWQNYSNWDSGGVRSLDPAAMRSFASGTFGSLVVLQLVGVLTMTPALCAGVIADEKQRKTLHYLLASRLTSSEIVLGKLMARMLQVGVFLAIGVPIITMLSLFGGVDPVAGWLAAAATFTIAFFLASLSVLCSTLAKRVREALSITYSLAGAWLVLPFLVRFGLPPYAPELYGFIRPANDLLMDSTPWAPIRVAMFTRIAGPTTLVSTTLYMMALQIGAGLMFLAFAVWRLRPVFKVQDGSIGRRFMGMPLPGTLRRIRLFGRKPVSDRAMLWKEMHTSRTNFAAQIVGIAIALFSAGAVGYWTWLFATDAIAERFVGPYDALDPDYAIFSPYSQYPRRAEFSLFLRWITASVGVVAILGAAVGGANTMTSEREEDTWLSLVATPLGGREIVVAKMIGVLWKTRWALLLIAAEWIVGMIAGSIHPIGVLFQAIALSSFLAFATALGTFMSIHSKSSWKSQATTVGVLAISCGGYLACCCPVLLQGRNSYLYLAGCMPFHLAMSPVSPWEFREVFVTRGTVFSGTWGSATQMAYAILAGVVAYAVGAIVLGVAAIASFDRAADRPHRDWVAIPEPAKLKG